MRQRQALLRLRSLLVVVGGLALAGCSTTAAVPAVPPAVTIATAISTPSPTAPLPTALPVAPTPTAGTPAAISGLHVAGNQIVNGAGQAVHLHGVNRSGTEYQCIHGAGFFDGPNDLQSLQAIAAWHVNTVRVPLNEDCWLGINGSPPAYSGPGYQQAIVDYVMLLNRTGLVAIVDLHWNAPGTDQAIGQQPMPDADHAPAFWTSVATTFKANSSVIFDLYNEPHDIPWTCWRDGGRCAHTSESQPYKVAGMQTLVTTVRATGASNILMLGGIAYANVLSGWLANRPTDPQNALVASWHGYNFNQCSGPSCYDTELASVAQKVPVVAGEIGEKDCSHGFLDITMDWLDAHNVGYLGWAWNVQDCSQFPALIKDYGGTPTDFGIALRDHLQALAK